MRVLLTDANYIDKVQKNNQLLQALKGMSLALDNEVFARDELLEHISKNTENELLLASATFVIILIMAIVFFNRRILHPLNDLKQLLQRLTEENYTPFETKRLDPLLLPVFNSYNDMVKHLAELEEANRRYAQSLQKDVRVATQALLEQQTSLARAERLAAIGEVAAELAHEIRNPLAGIQMAFNNLRREIQDPQQCERMELISSELKRLAHLSNDMLDQSRHAPESVSRFDIAVLVRDLVALTRYQIAETTLLTTAIPVPLVVNLPESGLRQALLNLLLNAAEAIEGPGVISVQAYRDDAGVNIQVIDNGSGFSQDMLEHGIRPFRTSRQRGTGLGLAMVLRFVKDLGGAVKLTNQHPQRGLRLHRVAKKLFRRSRCMIETLLIIEDEKLLGMELSRHYRQLGWEVVLADSIAKAKALLARQSLEPLLIISDMNLPDGHGLDFMETHKKFTTYAEWIFLTGYGSVPDSVRALRLGAYDFLEKPCDLERLDLVVTSAARSAASNDG